MTSGDHRAGEPLPAATGVAERILITVLRLAAVPLILLAALLLSLIYGIGYLARQARPGIAIGAALFRRSPRACDQQ